MVCHKDNLRRSASVLVWGVALVPVLASCEKREAPAATQDGVTGGYEQPSQQNPAPIDYRNAKPMPMPSIDGPPVKPDPRDAEIQYPGSSGKEEGSEGR